MRDFIISDIHGCFEELTALLEKIRFDKTVDRITFNGDLMDRGPDSFHCFQLALDLKREMGDRCSLIIGNHEMMLLDAADQDRMYHWMRNGCRATIDSFQANGADYRDAIEPIRRLFEPYVMLRGILVSHAGVTTDRPEDMDLYDLVWNRDAAFGRSLYRGCQIVGHTPAKMVYYVKRNPESRDTYHYNQIDTFLKRDIRCPIPDDSIFNIDGACVYGGQLICMELISEEDQGLRGQAPDDKKQACFYRIRSVKSRQERRI